MAIERIGKNGITSQTGFATVFPNLTPEQLQRQRQIWSSAEISGQPVQGPNGNMYNINNLPSNMRMATPDSRSAFGNTAKAVFKNDYALQPGDLGYQSSNPPTFGFANPGAADPGSPTYTGTGGAGAYTQPSGGNFLGNLLDLGGQYYMGQRGVQSVEDVGRQAMQQAQMLGQQAREDVQFRPFTVTTGTGVTTTTPTGGLDVGLGATAGGLEQQLQEQAGGLFGRVGVDPTTAQQEYFEQIRSVQRPEEERQRLAMEERLLGQGRLGLMTSQYGGTPEQFALAKAQEEARNQAAVMARSQALAEQQQALQMGSGLLGQSFVPQQQQLDALTAASNLANIAGTGQRTGAQLAAQLGSQGLESFIRAAESANLMQQREEDTLARLLLGGAGGTPGMLSGIKNPFTSGGAIDEAVDTPEWIKAIGDVFGFGGASGTRDVQTGGLGGLFGRIFGGGGKG